MPDLDKPLMLGAWSGWSDAGECATLALREVVHQIGAQRFASIDAEEFYNFTEERPVVRNMSDGTRRLIWPKNDIYYWKSGIGDAPDLVLIIGTEPHLKWRTYTNAVAQLGHAVGVELLATIGALLDSVPHTRAARVLCTTVESNLPERYGHIHYPRPNYEGPSGMTSATIDAFAKQGIKSVSIWGHAPHYLQVKRNPAITLAMLNEISNLTSMPFDTRQLERDAAEFEETITRAIESQDEVRSYVTRLEEQYDDEQTIAEDPVSGDVVQELDEFLRGRSTGNGSNT